MSQRTLVITFLALFSISAVFLFFQNARELDPNQGKNWWTLSFASPEQPENLSFVVDNHSDTDRFEYTIIINKTLAIKEAFIVEKGKSITITPEVPASSDARITITVTTGNGKKEIYR